jgi:hypothetical protein
MRLAGIRWLAIATALLLGGCVGDRYDYDWETPVFAVQTEDSVVVTVLDQRPEVLTGDKPANFVGFQRTGFGFIPYDVSTASGRPLADDMADTIMRGLAVNYVPVEAIYVPANADASVATQTVIAAGTDKGLVVLLRQWQTDTHVNIAFRYDLVVHVVDSNGNIYETATLVSERDELAGGDFLNPIGYATDHVPELAARTLERLINQPEIVAALQ